MKIGFRSSSLLFSRDAPQFFFLFFEPYARRHTSLVLIRVGKQYRTDQYTYKYNDTKDTGSTVAAEKHGSPSHKQYCKGDPGDLHLHRERPAPVSPSSTNSRHWRRHRIFHKPGAGVAPCQIGVDEPQQPPVEKKLDLNPRRISVGGDPPVEDAPRAAPAPDPRTMPTHLVRDDRIPLQQATIDHRPSRLSPCATSRHHRGRPKNRTTVAPKGYTPPAPRQHQPRRRRAGARARVPLFENSPSSAPSRLRRRRPKQGTKPHTYIHAPPGSDVPPTSSRPEGSRRRGERPEAAAEEPERRSCRRFVLSTVAIQKGHEAAALPRSDLALVSRVRRLQ